MNRNEISILFVATVGILAIVVILRLLNHIDTAQSIQIILTFTLVCVTTIYVKRTAEIAKADERIAEEMKQQRYSDSLPLLVPEISRRSVVNNKLDQNEIDYGTLQTGVGLEIIWHNIGKGTAIN